MLEWPFFDDAPPRVRGVGAPRTCRTGRGRTSTRAAAALVRALARDGWLEHAVGEPLDVRTLCLARETLAHHDALADFAFAMQGLGSGPISLFGSEEQRERVPARGRGGREDRGVRALRARRGLGRGGDDHHRRPAGA